MDIDTENNAGTGKKNLTSKAKENRPYGTNLAVHQKLTLWFAGASISLLLVSITVLVIVVINVPRQGGVCYNISESIRTGVKLEIAPDPIYYNLCGLQNCTFIHELCSIDCPLGYISDFKGCPVSCACGETGYFQGDIQFSSDDLSQLMLLISVTSSPTIDVFNLLEDNNANFKISTWGYGNRVIVPVVIDAAFDVHARSAISTVLSTFSDRTCVRFKERKDEVDYIHIYPSQVCSSRVGKRPGENILLLNKDYCIGTASIQHLFMHALGFYHEQSRPDRDNYVNILWDNVERSERHKLSKFNELYALNHGVEYNGKSLLHFPNKAFAVDSNKPTITGINGMKIRGEDPGDLFKGMNESDILKINSLYRCHGFETLFNKAQWSDWTSWTSSAAIQPTCIRKRSCLIQGSNTSGVCLTRDSVSAKFELATTAKCEQSSQVKLKTEEVASGSRLRNTKTAELKMVKGRAAPGTPTNPTRISRRVCANGKLLVGFFNGDSMSDLLCLYGDGFMRIYQAENEGYYERLNWEGPTAFCKYDPQANIIPSDINGDGYTDLVCHRSSGKIEVILLKSGVFQETLDWSGTIPQCYGGTKRMFIADVNGDRKGDLICGDKNNFHLESIFLNQYQPEV